MRIIEQSYKILHMPDDILGTIEQCARTCYQSQENIGCLGKTTDPSIAPCGRMGTDYTKCQRPECEHHSSQKFVKMLRDKGHHAMLEFGDITVKFITNRAVTHELVRHRIGVSYCLSGKTQIISYKDKKSRPTKKWTLMQLFNWQTDPKKKRKLGLIRLRSVDSDGIIVPGKIKQIVKSGYKKTYKVTTESGRQIKATMKHRFLTSSGWKRLREINIGDRVIANGMPAAENREWLEEKYIQENNTLEEMAGIMCCCVSTVTKILRSHGINKPLSLRKNRQPGHGNPGMFSDEQKEQISARMSGENNHRWKGEKITPQSGRSRAYRHNPIEVRRCWGCRSDSNLEMHHIDGNPVNNEAENIKILCQKCHKAFHYGQNVLTVFSDKVISISEYGYEETYDLEMAEKPHNFVADGLVVHNSQESTRYLKYDGDMEFIKPVWIKAKVAHSGKHFEDSTKKYLDEVATNDTWCFAMEQAERDYRYLLTNGWRPEQAREVLPNSLKTEIVVKANFRAWMHILTLRTSKKAHPQIRALMLPLLEELKTKIPVVFDDIG